MLVLSQTVCVICRIKTGSARFRVNYFWAADLFLIIILEKSTLHFFSWGFSWGHLSFAFEVMDFQVVFLVESQSSCSFRAWTFAGAIRAQISECNRLGEVRECTARILASLAGAHFITVVLFFHTRWIKPVNWNSWIFTAHSAKLIYEMLLDLSLSANLIFTVVSVRRRLIVQPELAWRFRLLRIAIDLLLCIEPH